MTLHTPPESNQDMCQRLAREFDARDLVRLLMTHLLAMRRGHARNRPLWSLVRDATARGSGLSIALCELYGLHPDTGGVAPPPAARPGPWTPRTPSGRRVRADAILVECREHPDRPPMCSREVAALVGCSKTHARRCVADANDWVEVKGLHFREVAGSRAAREAKRAARVTEEQGAAVVVAAAPAAPVSLGKTYRPPRNAFK